LSLFLAENEMVNKKIFPGLSVLCCLLNYSPIHINAQSVPNGYSLVWSDEFNDLSNGTSPFPRTTDWWYETGGGGWGNNELEYYVGYPGVVRGDTVAKLRNGFLRIKAIKQANPYYGCYYTSARINTIQSWTYGYFEARIKVPGGAGTWPAFWMLGTNISSVGWPLCGEIDIMEYAGRQKNVTNFTIHCQSYNGMNGTQKTSSKTISNAETDYHIYGLEWSSSKIVGYVDGITYFTFVNDGRNDVNTWPFFKPFYIKLNLAVGGNMGGSTIDPAAFPANYDIDYIRVYQKANGVDKIPNEQVHVYPTFFSNEITINTENPTQITIFDSTGKHLFTKTINGNVVLDMSNFKSGLYLLKTCDNCFKLIKK